jgi:hypothetical protein
MKAKGILFSILALATMAGAGFLLISMNKKDEDESSNFAGENENVLAENNTPYGEYFKDPIGITVKSRPFYKRNRGI